ncbi:STY4851/ECs_5259 family protein [Photobacterium kagoshimensis]|uniref:STY4851/ECs_5259 family protein n=1 Tax=Photobacterium kagoshimensis TaxID=2910242 RepID=UPI003D130EB8
MSSPVAIKKISISSWLEQFLQSRSERRQQAVPLYQYHITNEEYCSLKQLLIDSCQFGINAAFTREWCGVFTLYCSEWFRREYSREWSWQPIFDKLSFELTPQQISDVVSRGLQSYWGRPLSKYSSERNDYLGSVFREGGLPSNLLSSDTNNYQIAFYSIFENYQDAKELGSGAIAQLIKHKILRLPETLQGQESIDLIASMVDQLDKLVYQFGLDSQPNPAQYLDSQFPRWRETFPLPLEDSTGLAFLSQLLTCASDEVRKVAKVRKQLSCKHYLSFSNQAVSTRISLPHRCQFELPKQQLSSSRLELAVFEGENQVASLGTGYAQFEGEQTHVRMRNHKVLVRRENPDSELYIVAMQAGRKLAEIRLAASAVDVGDTPLTLVSEGEQWRVVGQASISVKQQRVGVLLPTSAKINVINGDIFETKLCFSNLALKELEGRCEVILNGEERYVISTGSESFLGANLILGGEQLLWKSSPALVFKGVPKVCRDHGCDMNNLAGLQTYLGNTEASLISQSEVNGRQLLSVRNSEGLVLLRKRVGILPNDFDIVIQSGKTPNEGVVKVITASPCVCRVISKNVTVDAINKEPGATVIQISAISAPPATVSLQVRASVLSEPIDIEVPFPSRGAIAYNAKGRILASELTIDSLLGSRLHLFSPRGIPAEFQIEAIAPHQRGRSSKLPYFRWHYRVTDKPVEVSLYGLKDALLELLSLTEQLDGEVELVVTGPGKSLRFSVSHYSTTLEHNRVDNTVFVRSQALLSSEKVKPVLMSLSAPEQKPMPLISRESEGVVTGEYELPSFISELGRGPWLIVPDKLSDVAFRAKFIAAIEGDCNVDEVNTLQKASMVYHPRFQPDVIADVLKQMRASWAHTSWQYMKETYGNYSHLPLSTFEVWRHLVRDNRALAVAVFKFECDDKFISHLESELPVFWEFISIDDWFHAASLMRKALSAAGLPDQVVEQVSATQIDKLALAIPALSETVAGYLKSGIKPQAFPAPMMSVMAQGWYQDLLRQHSEDNSWPTEYGNEIKLWCLNLKLSPVDLTVNAGFQTGVVYLPLFTAAMASNRIPSDISDLIPTDAIFHFRKLRDFDREWFEPLYRCFIAYFANNA